MKVYATLDELRPLVGTEIGVSDWITVTQERIDKFADATGDHQWIHVDRERAAQGPYGTTVAHGFMTLALLPELSHSAYTIADTRLGINYGLDRVRFPAPVKSGSRLRGRFRLLAFAPLADDGAQLKIEVTMEVEGGDKPVCVAESLARRYTSQGSQPHTPEAR